MNQNRNIPKSIKIIEVLMRIEGWLGIVLSLGLFIVAIVYPSFIYFLEDFVDGVHISHFIYLGVIILLFSIADLVIVRRVIKRKKWARNLSLLLSVVGIFVFFFPIGFLFSIPLFIYLFKKDTYQWFNIKTHQLDKMPRKIKLAKIFLQIIGWLYLVFGIILYATYLLLDYLSDNNINFDCIVFIVFLLWLSISIFIIWIGRSIKKRKNWIRILAFFFAAYIFFSFPFGTIISILIFFGTMTKDADSWFNM